jgi:Holliday junction resolvase RusA-like endonuclease
VNELRFQVLGVAAPQGSKRSVGRGIMIESSKAVRPWRDSVAYAAIDAAQHTDWTPPGAARVSLWFFFSRPRSHYRTGRHSDQLRPSAPAAHTSRPDVDKLSRAVLDALTTSGVIRDDSTVAVLNATKAYVNDVPHLQVAIQPLEP